MIKETNIQTNRLIIRPYKESDLLEAFQLMQEKDLFQYLPMEVMSLEDYKGLFSWLINCYETSYKEDWFKYSFVITDRETGNHIGWCGVGCLDFNHDYKEVFYLIGKSHWGRGYATEAVQGLINYCFNNLGLSKLTAVVKPENKASKNVLEKLGFCYEFTVSDLPEEFDFYNGELLYSISKEM
ncbi:GNAT family N-acetyltransferase [Paenibacillus sp. MB22_1]|uniref:GNAT family N-acetyltransferase n=1 Tax=Paenibacillus sp. MB22_1 TaxID=3383121 RepID=UPI0039A3DF87